MKQASLFDEAHDPGGKSKISLGPGVRGDAEFYGDRDVYRPVLRRWVGDKFPMHDFMLFIGMNPSTAGANVNDPTVLREWNLTVREGCTGYVKVNIADYRATNPKDLLVAPVPIRSDANMAFIMEAAIRAVRIVVCHGKLNSALKGYGQETIDAIRSLGLNLWCLGVNLDGSPKHPLYIKASAPLLLF